MHNGEKQSAGFKGYSARNGHVGPGSAADSPLGKLLLQSRSGRREPSAAASALVPSRAAQPLVHTLADRVPGQRHQGFVACNFTDLDHNLPVTFTLFAELTGAAVLALPEIMTWFESPFGNTFPLSLTRSAPETPTKRKEEVLGTWVAISDVEMVWF